MSALPAQPTPLIGFLERAARDPDFDLTKFESLLRMQRDVEQEQARRAFNRAMAMCQQEMQPVLKDAVNPHAHSRYAKLETIDSQMRPIYTRNGFSVRFGSAPSPREGWMRITCTIAHQDGYAEENYLDSPISTLGSQGGKTAMTGVQSVGSVVTYLRRYLLTMCFNIVLADEDDDGEAARTMPAPFKRPAPPPRPADEWTEPSAENGLPNYTIRAPHGGEGWTYHTGSDWMSKWSEGINRLKFKPNELRTLRELNRASIAAVADFDPEAAATVEQMLEAILEPPTGKMET